MKKSYDFSKSVKNPYLQKPKKQLTIRLDEDTIEYFRSLAEQRGIPYQSLMNLYLRDCAAENKKLLLKWAS
ncbi:MAG: BrnA antitoxin family protein [Pseudomonadales bacterium]